MSFVQTLSTAGTTLTGLTIDGGNAFDLSGILVQADDCVIQDCEIMNLDGIGIYVQTGKRLKIRHCNVHDTGRQGVAFTGAQDFSGTVIEHNTFARTAYDSLQIGGNGITVKNNHMSGGGFGGVYALTGTTNISLTGNVIEDAYGGFDLSWGAAGVNRAGTQLTGRVVANNIIRGCVCGIGTGGNGTIIRDNQIYDCGNGKQQTYTLLGSVPQIAVAGTGYRVNDPLTFSGGTTDYPPARVRVTAVDGSGGVAAYSMLFIGCYYAVPANPIQLNGGSGIGAAISIPSWDARSFVPNGINIVDACNCVVTGNISGNTDPSNRTQRVGCALSYVFDKPARNVVTGNSFPNNSDHPIAGIRGASYDQTLLVSNQIATNV